MSTAAKQTLDNGATITINKEQILAKFRRALLIDDDIEYGDSVRRNLETIGFETTVVGSLDAGAQELSSGEYPIVLCDNIFEDRPKRKGSEFLRDETELLGTSKAILMTGFALQQIVDLDLLKMRDVKILKKGEGHIDKLKDMCQEIVEDRAKKYEKKMRGLCEALVERVDDETEFDDLINDPYLVARAKTYLINYMKKFPSQELEQFFIAERAYSPKELVEEIRKGTKVSRLLIDSLLDDILEGSDAQ